MRQELPQQKRNARMNHNIRVPNVRVVKAGEQLGIMPTAKAIQLAMEEDLDLIEIVPHAHPPVCHIVDYGEFKYRQKIEEKNQRRKQKETQIETKEMRFRPGTDDHDIETKVKNIQRFLSEGKKVQINVDFRYRELAHKEEGYAIMNQVIDSVGDAGILEIKPKLEGKRLTARLTFKAEK